MELCDRIKSLRLEQQLTQKELSQRMNVSEVSVRCWESGTKNPSMSAIVSLAKMFGVSTDYLLCISSGDRDNLILDRHEMTLLSNYRALDKHGKKAVETICMIEKDRVLCGCTPKTKPKSISMADRYIPLYTTPSAAGYSAPLDGDDFKMIFVDDTVPPDADFAVRIQGNSMSPYIHDGETVYVKRDCELEVGDVGIFCVDGAMYCKQYYIDTDGNMTLVSANDELRHTNVIVKADSGSEVRCYGKVLLGISIGLPSYIVE